LEAMQFGEQSSIHMAEKFGMIERMLEKIGTRF